MGDALDAQQPADEKTVLQWVELAGELAYHLRWVTDRGVSDAKLADSIDRVLSKYRKQLDEHTERQDAPVRLCCGQRHGGPSCPGGTVMCCVCFETVKLSELHRLPNGNLENVCMACAAKESADAAREGGS